MAEQDNREGKAVDLNQVAKVLASLRKLQKQGEDYIWRPASRAADLLEAMLAEIVELRASRSSLGRGAVPPDVAQMVIAALDAAEKGPELVGDPRTMLGFKADYSTRDRLISEARTALQAISIPQDGGAVSDETLREILANHVGAPVLPVHLHGEAMVSATTALAAMRTVSRLRGEGEIPEGWRPIESAPKDGDVLLCGPRNGKIVVKSGRWDAQRYNEKPRPYWAIYGWPTTWCREFEPEFWMPLPPPPSQKEQG